MLLSTTRMLAVRGSAQSGGEAYRKPFERMEHESPSGGHGICVDLDVEGDQ